MWMVIKTFNAVVHLFEWLSLKCRRTPSSLSIKQVDNENMWALINSSKSVPLSPVVAMLNVVSIYCFYLITGSPIIARALLTHLLSLVVTVNQN